MKKLLPTVTERAIAVFWRWWKTAHKKIEIAIANNDLSPTQDIAKHVRAIDKRLHWELGSGARSKYVLLLSSNGDPELRVIARRWEASAPRRDKTWEYASARPAKHDATVTYARRPMRLAECSFAYSVDKVREVLDVTLFHPTFTKLTKDDRESSAVLLLDAALGEDDVERWVGAIAVARARPRGARTFASFAKAVDKLRKSARGESIVTLEGTDGDGDPIEVVYNAALKRIDHPDLDQYVRIGLHLDAPTEEGLASRAEARKLDALDGDLAKKLGRLGVVLGHETVGGHRIIHLFIADEATKIVQRWLTRQRAYGPHVERTRDVAWDAAHQW